MVDLPSWKKTRPKVRKHLGKHSPQVDVIDEWEEMDVDRDEQKAGLKRREKRWKEIALEKGWKKKQIDKVIKNADKIEPDLRRGLTPQEELWLQVDFVLSYVMEEKAYNFVNNVKARKDIKTYNKLLNIFFSDKMRANLAHWVAYFALNPYRVDNAITLASVVKEYRKIKGIKTTNIKIIHKGEDEKEL
ncbi:MAG: hypothetical protein ACW991_09425 [Candidatus Hodarchaeales archaeon]